ncbi:MAG TPA: carboxypeptidase-like regulatory domain-containing protein [Jatrophihabitans sp.]|nr:carboxypeptidase-like regulatory domain-containing protein [Jatrophihabitans sp.]
MLVSAQSQLIDVPPGGSADVVLEVRNTSEIIDGVTTRIIGVPVATVTSRPALLPLFPDASGQVTVSVGLPTSYPAGRHPVTVEVASAGAGLPSAYLDLDLLVPPRPELTLSCRPQLIRARRQARFAVHLSNTGNVPMNVELVAVDADRAVSSAFQPARLRVEAGSVATSLLTVRGPRMITGAEIDRTLTVQATAQPAGPAEAVPPDGETVHYTGKDEDEFWLDDLRGAPGRHGTAADGTAAPDTTAPDGTAPNDAGPGNAARPASAGGGRHGSTVASDAEIDPAGQLPPMVQTCLVRLRQRPLLSRGLLTALVLMAIVGLWAAAFLLGLGQAFKGEPMTKQAPASFFAGIAAQNSPVGANAAAVTSGGAPAGALPKTGPLPPGVGAIVSGTVTATSNHQPTGRILVEALRRTDTGLQVVSSAATQSDGTYSLAGLFPTGYLIRFSATGYRTVWYPGVPTEAGARLVGTTAAAVTGGIDAVITGLPASIQGSIDPGDTLQQVTATVQATSLVGNVTKPIATATTVAGKYRLANLPAPGTYQLSFTAPGYQPTTVVTTVGGGQQRYQPTVLLSVGNGQIGGTVTGGGQPLGGVVITTTVNGKDVTVGTPTTGAVGSFLLPNLPTPQTYVLTFTAPGYGSQTSVVQLGPGQSRTGLRVDLTPGVGSVTGVLTDSDGNRLGGATVTVGGAPTAMNTTTLTTGAVGYFSVNSLPAPGEYTLTFSLPGYAATTVPIALTADGAPPTVRVTMATALGSITGVITDPDGAPRQGATVTATDGRQNWQVQSTGASPGLASGGYLLADLQPGTYTVTVTLPGFGQQTALLTVTAGQTVRQDLQLQAVS